VKAPRATSPLNWARSCRPAGFASHCVWPVQPTANLRHSGRRVAGAAVCSRLLSRSQDRTNDGGRGYCRAASQLMVEQGLQACQRSFVCSEAGWFRASPSPALAGHSPLRRAGGPPCLQRRLFWDNEPPVEPIGIISLGMRSRPLPWRHGRRGTCPEKRLRRRGGYERIRSQTPHDPSQHVPFLTGVR